MSRIDDKLSEQEASDAAPLQSVNGSTGDVTVQNDKLGTVVAEGQYDWGSDAYLSSFVRDDSNGGYVALWDSDFDPSGAKENIYAPFSYSGPAIVAISPDSQMVFNYKVVEVA
jgi:hypothetical protein